MFSSEFMFAFVRHDRIFALAGARLGVDAAVWFAPAAPGCFLHFCAGRRILFGLIITPWLTIRPKRGCISKSHQ